MKISSDLDLKIIKKVEFAAVDFIFDALHEAFMPNGLKDDESPPANFLALWTLSLSCCGWTEEEYWEEQKSQCTCKDCGGPLVEVPANNSDIDKKAN